MQKETCGMKCDALFFINNWIFDFCSKSVKLILEIVQIFRFLSQEHCVKYRNFA